MDLSTAPVSTLVKVYTQNAKKKEKRKDREYLLLTGLPLKPYFERITIRTEVVKDTMWTFEQPQGFFNVSTSIRMTVVRLKSGGLWCHAPVAPTGECVRLLDELGTVEHIVLPTTALEHKVYIKDFSRRYPKAKVWAAPDQWSWPINLPPPFRIDGVLKDGDPSAPWYEEIEQALFRPPVIGIGPANEVAFFHKASATLIVTDLIVYIAKDPVKVVEIDELLEAAKEDETEVVQDTLQTRQKGWARMALQILFLGPTRFNTFKLISNRLLVSPVIETFVLSKIPEATADFINRITSRWRFTQVIPAHFNAPAAAGPEELQQAYAFAYKASGIKPATPAKGGSPWKALLTLFSPKAAASIPVKYPDSDMATLNFVNKFIVSAGFAER